ncbi:MAG: CDP-diacylglycerol--serine O-phosphatidyltransferase [Firmicutes bacterium]|nr:CDP-diacylglycerol--serine O-phosphatidyltransferase [Bacillota bacterium]
MRKRLTPEERRDRRRRVVRRSKFALPSMVTLISVLCGFSSVVMSLNAAGDNPQWHFFRAAMLLVLAGVFDGLDGRIARATNTATEFGVQLDSLADVLSFGMAPAILAYRYGFFQLGMEDPQLRAVGWAASFFFIACGALRLARFNVQVGEVDSRFFVGMPIPAGAACVASVILAWPKPPSSPVMAYIMAFGLFAVGLLMVSTVRFPNFKKLPPQPSVRRWITIGIVAILCLLIVFPKHFFVGFFAVYILMGLSLNLAWLLGWRGVLPPKEKQHGEIIEVDEAQL